jgi:hypothetical protein
MVYAGRGTTEALQQPHFYQARFTAGTLLGWKQVIFMEGMMSTSLYFVQEGEVEVFSVVHDGSAAERKDAEGGDTSRTAVSDDAAAEAVPVPTIAKTPPKVEETTNPAERKQKTAAELNAEWGIVGTSKPKPVEAPPEPEQSTDTPAAPDDEEKILGTYPYGGTFGEAAFVFQIYHPYSLRARWTNDVKALMLSLADYDRILETHPQVWAMPGTFPSMRFRGVSRWRAGASVDSRKHEGTFACVECT